MIATPKYRKVFEVFLRNGTKAFYWYYPIHQVAEPFVLIGRDVQNTDHAWKRDGKWSYDDDSESEFDIVSYCILGGKTIPFRPMKEL